MLCVRNFYDAIDGFAPFHTAESWDNSGLLVGSPETPVTGVLVALDATEPVLQHALQRGANLLITHHPVIFSPLRRLEEHSLVYRLAQSGIAVISAHTNLDVADGGVNDALAQRLELRGVRKLEAPPALLRAGELQEPLPPPAFAKFVQERLQAPGVRAALGTRPVQTVALCGGAGADRLSTAIQSGAQAYVTADVKHHEWLQAREAGITLVDGGHFHTEAVVLRPLADRLCALLPEAAIAVDMAGEDSVQYFAG